MYVTEKSRRNGKATWLAECIESNAKQEGCVKLTTTINTGGKIDVTRSMKAILSYGFKYVDSCDGYLLFEKVIK